MCFIVLKYMLMHLEILTRPVKELFKPFTQGVFISSVKAHWALYVYSLLW